MVIPVDSTDARELREREAELEAQAAEEQRRHAVECVDGWRGEDLDGHPVPCLTCRPHLAIEPTCLTCHRAKATCDGLRTASRGRCCDTCDHRRNDR